MVDRRSLVEVLSQATDWVRAEFAYVEDLAAELGWERHVENGPGVAFRLDGKAIVHAHPKLKWLCLGLPERMRGDVEALTAALRPQKGAWFNYQPGVADRDTVELLLSSSAEAADSANRTSNRPPRRDVRDQSRVAADDADLCLVLAVLRAFQHHETTTGRRSALKPLRETLFFRWEGPRLPAGNKYSPLIPHSPAAREHRAAHGHAGLVYEHVVPVSSIIRELLREMPADEQSLREVLEAKLDRVLITKTEDQALTAAGFRDTIPEPDDPWSRYRHALGLQRSDFAAFAGP